MHWFDDPCQMPDTSLGPEEVFSQAQPLVGTPGEAYVRKRGISTDVAHAAGLRFHDSFDGRPAVLIALANLEQTLTSVHGRYLYVARGQNKMLTVGISGGVISILGGWRSEPMILVEGLFDALSLAECGTGSVATIGRWAPWLPQVCSGRTVWLAFDASRPGEIEANRYRTNFPNADMRRLRPPPHAKDWNTALLKKGRHRVSTWIYDCIGAS